MDVVVTLCHAGVRCRTGRVRMVWSGVVLVMIVLCDAVGLMDLLTVACLGVSSLLLMRSLTVDEALAATRPRILIMIAASFALGSALQVCDGLPVCSSDMVCNCMVLSVTCHAGR